jgi:hypothetical protein
LQRTSEAKKTVDHPIERVFLGARKDHRPKLAAGEFPVSSVQTGEKEMRDLGRQNYAEFGKIATR